MKKEAKCQQESDDGAGTGIGSELVGEVPRDVQPVRISLSGFHLSLLFSILVSITGGSGLSAA